MSTCSPVAKKGFDQESRRFSLTYPCHGRGLLFLKTAAQNLNLVWSSGGDVAETVDISRFVCRDQRDSIPLPPPSYKTCGAPLNGRVHEDGTPVLCEAQCLVRCPLHGTIIERDPITGTPVDEEYSKKSKRKKKAGSKSRKQSKTQLMKTLNKRWAT
eukprot:m.235689 g.235689  ORF g.235689 m.235689 type:complete len:157 (-) comp17092_c1_seq41:5107-5577(-)